MPTRLRLKDVILAEFNEKQTSIAKAASARGLQVDRLKRSLRQNRFSEADLRKLMPGVPLEQLLENYEFETLRDYGARPRISRGGVFVLFDALTASFQHLQAAAKVDITEFVDELYHKMGSNHAMFLFCDETLQPIEWDSESVRPRKLLAERIADGASIFYVTKSNWNPGEKFEDFWSDIKEKIEKARVGKKKSGVLALLRVSQCSFCIPYQKPTLFVQRALDAMEDEGEHVERQGMVDDEVDGDDEYKCCAMTTVELPHDLASLKRGETLLVPQSVPVAFEMRNQLRRIAAQMSSTGAGSQNDVSFRCYPPREKPADFVDAMNMFLQD